MKIKKNNKKQVLKNAAVSVFQVVVLSLVPFVLYRFIIDTIGVESLGIWSVVLSTTSITRISELGLSSSVVKFVAKYIAKEDHEKAAGVIQTAFVSVLVIVGIILLLIFPFSDVFLRLVVPAEGIELALSILPFAFISLFFNVIASVIQSGIDGCQRIDLRSFIKIGSSLFYLLASIGLTPQYGLLGLAYSQVLQALLTLMISWGFLRKLLKPLPIFPYRWNKNLFKEMISYGVNFQIVSVVKMLYDPITTAFLSRFGGLAVVGYFHMAKRMVRQVRSLIVSANQSVIPFIADLQERLPEKVQYYYKMSYDLMTFISIPVFSFVVAVSPVVSEIWVGFYEETFVLFATILALGWFVNTLNSPAYFANLGIGDLKWNTISHITIGVLNGILGFTLGSLYGGKEVIIGWVLSLIGGSFLIVIPYHKKNGISLKYLIPEGSFSLSVACLSALGASLFLYYQDILGTNRIISFLFYTALFVVITAFPLWRHPMREKLVGWAIRNLGLKAKEM
jgi:O-antigen/teichoic acid export membrane protein